LMSLRVTPATLRVGSVQGFTNCEPFSSWHDVPADGQATGEQS
jgi:hypothetical protein